MTEPCDQTLTLRISTSLSDAIDALADAEERSRSDMARVLLRKGISTESRESVISRYRGQLFVEYGRPEIIASGTQGAETIAKEAARLGVTLDETAEYCVVAYANTEAAVAFGNFNRRWYSHDVHGPYEVDGQVRNIIRLQHIEVPLWQ
jgi:predicted transcriptional regulator